MALDPPSGDFRSIQIKGLAEFRRDLRRVSPQLARRLTGAHRKIATQIAGESKVRARGVSRQYAAAVDAIRGRASQRSAAVVLDATRVPWIHGAEFGALMFRQFQPWRGNAEWAGYAVYPTIRDSIPEIIEHYADNVMEAFGVAYPIEGL